MVYMLSQLNLKKNGSPAFLLLALLLNMCSLPQSMNRMPMNMFHQFTHGVVVVVVVIIVLLLLLLLYQRDSPSVF